MPEVEVGDLVCFKPQAWVNKDELYIILEIAKFALNFEEHEIAILLSKDGVIRYGIQALKKVA
jgi:hypothetical protein